MVSLKDSLQPRGLFYLTPAMFQPFKIRHYLELMSDKGFSPEQVLLGTGISESALADQNFLLDVNQAKQIVANMISLSGDQGIGLEAGSRTDLLDLGLLGHAMITAPTARVAAQYWISYSNALVGMLIHVRLEEVSQNDWVLVITEAIPLGSLHVFCVEEYLVMSYRLSAAITGKDSIIKELEVAYPSPAHQAVYEKYFPVPIRFNAMQTRIRFVQPRLDLPMRGTNREFHELCVAQCEFMLQKLGRQSPYKAKVMESFFKLHGYAPTLEIVAQDLSVSPRYLRRRLAEEGLSFQGLLNDFRLTMIKDYLKTTAMTHKEISYLLGFKEVNSMRRAFRGWTGRTLQEYRDSKE